MSIIIERFNKIKSNIEKISIGDPGTIVAVSKTFSLSHIMPLIEHGHEHFGENKVQEADSKWREIKKERTNIKLHLIGKLQSNKAKKAVEIFDYIHSLDSQKLADILSKKLGNHLLNAWDYQSEERKKDFFTRVHSSFAPQKPLLDFSEFLTSSRNNKGLINQTFCNSLYMLYFPIRKKLFKKILCLF